VRGSTRHTGNFSADSLQVAQQVWLPHLLTEVAAYRHGDKPVPRPAGAHGADTPVGASSASSLVRPAKAADNDDLLADPAPAKPADKDDLLTDEPAVAPKPVATAAKASTPAAAPALEYDDAEARVAEGGWYRRDNTYTIYYRPSGHADEFLTAWLETAASDSMPAARTIYAELASPKAPGVCMKCHTTDRTGNTSQVNWLTSRPQPQHRPFTKFKHAPHFSLMGVQGCSTCHVMDLKADYASAFGDSRDSTIFHSNFAPLTKNSCVACHQPSLAGASCQECHNYHTGELRQLHLQAAEVKGASTGK
jgi:cytochrome c551/c552